MPLPGLMFSFLLLFFASSFSMSESKSRVIKTGAFNVQIFGASFMKSGDQVNALLKIIRRYDVVAIQEVSDE